MRCCDNLSCFESEIFRHGTEELLQPALRVTPGQSDPHGDSSPGTSVVSASVLPRLTPSFAGLTFCFAQSQLTDGMLLTVFAYMPLSPFPSDIFTLSFLSYLAK